MFFPPLSPPDQANILPFSLLYFPFTLFSTQPNIPLVLSCLHEKDKLKSAIPTLSLMSSLRCETYQLRKHHLSTFSSYSLDSQSNSFDVVCTNIWNSSLMVLLKALRRIWLQKGIHKHMVFDHMETFSHEAGLNYVEIIHFIAVSYSQPFYQLDIKNASLHGEPYEEVYMLLPVGSTLYVTCERLWMA